MSSVEPLDTPTQQALYEELPDTPNGPGEMFVSPLSGKKGKLGVLCVCSLCKLLLLYVLCISNGRRGG